ncbi:MAG TPA: dihydrofolate reductase family protein [Candidatus Limnocylindrales bacterium]|jgi:dihydrofolate reductase|nr:dihydrofolate reductase family protein [Candidatus Limnocylindrales bacterium]
MRKIIAGLFISLDGVVEAPETWHFPYFNEEMGEAVAAQAEQSDTMLLGRKTYQEFAAYWPNQSSEEPFADVMNDTSKLVASTTLKEVAWQNSTLIEGDVVTALTRIKQDPGRDISITGSPTLVRSLLRAGVLDELRLLVHPIVVGHGKRLFEAEDQPIPLRLIEAKTFTTGVQAMTYAPATK